MHSPLSCCFALSFSYPCGVGFGVIDNLLFSHWCGFRVAVRALATQCVLHTSATCDCLVGWHMQDLRWRRRKLVLVAVFRIALQVNAWKIVTGGEACGRRVHASLCWSWLCGEACVSPSHVTTRFGQGRACLSSWQQTWISASSCRPLAGFPLLRKRSEGFAWVFVPRRNCVRSLLSCLTKIGAKQRLSALNLETRVGSGHVEVSEEARDSWHSTVRMCCTGDASFPKTCGSCYGEAVYHDRPQLVYMISTSAK